MELIVTLSRGRGLIVLSVVGIGLLGVLYSVATPSRYTAESKVIREAGEGGGGPSLPSGIGGIAGGLGIDIGVGGSVGLSPASYPEIATSREVRLAVARDTFYFPSLGRRTTFVDYVNRPPGTLDQILSYTVYLPWTVKGALGSLIGSGQGKRSAGTDSTGTLIYPTEEEEEAISALGEMVSASVSESGALEGGSGLMTVSASSGNPKLSARLNERFIEHLRTRIRELQTEKTRRNLRFVEKRFEEVKQELDAAENRLVQFLERNKGVLAAGSKPQLESRRERLRREVGFKEQLYSQMQKQVTQTRLQLQKEQPVVTIAEKPAPPAQPSAPNRTLNVVLSLFLGGLFGVGATFFRSAIQSREDDEEVQEQIQEVQKAWKPSGIVEGVREEFGIENDPEGSLTQR
ncbi:HPt (histidine-containing phosphotransfer) domain-containing protein [Salinibacter ruber]|nr:HPt (histidine-containing phosphotransfer) domain-containing protein [Salinibacter ruber]